MALNPDFVKIGHDIIAAAFEVRKNSGPGLRESYYESAFAFEIQQLGYSIERQVSVPVVYKGIIIENAYVVDMIVDKRVLIEFKAIGTMRESEPRQLLTYMKLSKIPLGYLINFGAEQFGFGSLRDSLPYNKGIYRIVNNI